MRSTADGRRRTQVDATRCKESREAPVKKTKKIKQGRRTQEKEEGK